jgi:hypothetical protein
LKLVSNLPEADEKLLGPYLDLVCMPSFLDRNFRNGKSLSLAGGLTHLALSQPPEIIARFRCPGLRARFTAECANLATTSGPTLLGAVQFIGACSLIGHDSTSPDHFKGARLAEVGRMPTDDLPYSPEATDVTAYQRQLWFGLREVARVAPETLRVDQGALRQTLRLWRNNHAATSSDPSSTAHWINTSMVNWLAICNANRAGQLEPSNEPLWLLTGFPDNPSDFASET